MTEKITNFFPALDGVAVAESVISHPDTEKGMLFYQGYPIDILAEKASFEEVAYLILFGELPTEKELKYFQEKLQTEQWLPNGAINTIRLLGSESSLFSMVAAGVLGVARYDKDLENMTREKNEERAISLIAKMPIIVVNAILNKKGAGQQFISQKLSPLSNFIDLLNIRMDKKMQRAFEVGQILCCEHEMNASTLAVRIAASAGSDIYSAISAGLNIFRGVYHGGASQFVIKMLKDIGSPANIQKWVDQKLLSLNKKDRIMMGFGHRIYKGAGSDPRTTIFKKWAVDLSKNRLDKNLIETAQALEKYIGEKKNLCANVDLYFAIVNHYLNFKPAELYPLIYAMARVVGWTAHYIEQFHNPEGRIFRPRAIYTGPDPRQWVDIKDRQ